MTAILEPGSARLCSRSRCFAPETACVLGLSPCPNLSPANPKGAQSRHAEGRPLPWSGLALGLADLAAIAALGRPHLVAVVGGANAGKTTLLAAHWIATRRGVGQFGRNFAGSYTLAGWHQIAHHLQWVPHGSGFPPHTRAPDRRTPALLHMVVDVGRSVPSHVLHTDVPGEWYAEWAYETSRAPGAAWIAEAADAFVIVADSAALSGSERGVARGDYETLASRLASVAAGRPVVPVQTKADLPVADTIQAHLDRTNIRLFDARTLRVSVYDRGNGPITAPIELAVAAALASHPTRVIDSRSFRDPFLAFRTVAGTP